MSYDSYVTSITMHTSSVMYYTRNISPKRLSIDTNCSISDDQCSRITSSLNITKSSQRPQRANTVFLGFKLHFLRSLGHQRTVVHHVTIKVYLIAVEDTSEQSKANLRTEEAYSIIVEKHLRTE